MFNPLPPISVLILARSLASPQTAPPPTAQNSPASPQFASAPGTITVPAGCGELLELQSSNGYDVDNPGVINSLPCPQNQTVEDDKGTIEQTGVRKKAPNAGEIAKGAVPRGATIGLIDGLNSGHPLAGGLEGAGAGLSAAGIMALFTSDLDINIPSNRPIERVLQQPLLLKLNLDGLTTLVPASTQPQTLPKPALHRDHMLCPTGSLGCN